MEKTMKDIREFTKRVPGDTKVVVETSADGVEYEINDMWLVKAKDGMKLVLEIG